MVGCAAQLPDGHERGMTKAIHVLSDVTNRRTSLAHKYLQDPIAANRVQSCTAGWLLGAPFVCHYQAYSIPQLRPSSAAYRRS